MNLDHSIWDYLNFKLDAFNENKNMFQKPKPFKQGHILQENWC